MAKRETYFKISNIFYEIVFSSFFFSHMDSICNLECLNRVDHVMKIENNTEHPKIFQEVEDEKRRKKKNKLIEILSTH